MMSRITEISVLEDLRVTSILGAFLFAQVCWASDAREIPSRDGLLAWYDAADASSLKGEGGEIMVWQDKSGNGFDLKKKTGMAGPKLQEGGDSRSVSGGVLVCPGVRQSSDCLTVYAVVKTEPTNSPIIAFSDSAGPDACAAGWTTGAAPGFLSSKGHVQASSEVEDGQWHILTFWRQGALRRFYVDGVLAGESTATAEPTQINDLLLFEYPQAACFSGEMAELLVYTRAQSEVEVAETQIGLREKWKALMPEPDGDLLVFVGNSISTGMFCGNGKTWSREAATKLPGVKNWYNVSKGAVTTKQLSEMAGTMIDPLLALRKGTSTLVFWEGTNELVVNRASAEDAAARIGEFCTARKKAGWNRVVVLNVLPREAGQEFELRRQELNRLLRADPVGLSIDVLVDVAAVPEIGAAGQERDKAYYSDGVHLNARGQTIVAEAVVPALESLSK